jgi:[acyl-carrier-protein] S-malonyltransferase
MRIEEAVSYNVSNIINHGSMDVLTQTQNAQIAIFASSMVIFNVLKYEFGFNVEERIEYMAGHSLGEYTALCASSAISLEEAALLVWKRGEIMASVASGQEYAMVAILGDISIEKIEDLTTPYKTGRSVCVIANDNSSSQIVISGNAEVVNIVAQKALEIGAKNIVKLNTSGPFHSPLMVNAAIELDKAITCCVNLDSPRIPVIMNVTATPMTDKAQIPALLIQQLTSKVRWRESIDFMIRNGITKIVEIGPGKILTRLGKRAYPNIDMIGIETFPEIEAFVNS